MADYAISSANLNVIENNIGTLARQLERVADNVDNISGMVNLVDSKVNSISSSLNDLTAEFKVFVDESKRVALLSDAKQNVVMLEQQIEKDYGYYDNIRRHTVGILQAADVNIVRKETIANITEEMMIAAPRYWLAPALIALSAWLSDNRELAEKALKEAMRRDDEKTSLMFCLISRRAGRLDGSLVWLERYFAMQDPTKMERRIIVVLDAFASGLFGADSKGVCSEKIKAWLSELSARVGFVEEQKTQWEKAIIGKKASLGQDEFPYLKQYSPTWEKLKDVLEWAKTHNDIYQYFSTIFNAPVDNVASITAKIDDLLDSLVTNYDNEELPLRKQLRKNKLVIEENGNMNRANSRFDSEVAAYEQYEDFSQHLTSIALAPESSGTLVATQKLAIALSKEWIFNAYEDITVKSRAEVPLDIEIAISNWSGTTRDGSNETELQQSLNEFVDDTRDKAIASIKWFRGNIILSIIIGIIVGFLGLNTIIVPILAVVAVAVYIFMEKSKYNKNVKATKKQMEEYRENTMTALNATIAEIVDYRRLYTEKDSEYTKVEDFFRELQPEQYISVGDVHKFRQVI
ncbi:hypothetical protein QA584_04665 [Anaerocolumna sp. AGMB13025]|uniref:hypothetical protein n=1 Tax=Anaerocolumna sp. AGMB13025 TaxID=3039116 RepID=UPI00241FA703|nr:hypothetical protein [Anaerocolumna sp. AGMB13025]WFR58366.1 hypothetical protein QA584_04665 [Anaerocolumna sp. AGMB13025]